MEGIGGDAAIATSAGAIKQMRLARSARRARVAANAMLIVAVVVFVAATIGAAVTNFSNDQNFGNSGTPFKYQFGYFVQSVAYNIGFLLIAAVGAALLRLQADRLAIEADALVDAADSVPRGDELVVDFTTAAERRPPTTRPALDDSLWRPPETDAAENPFQRSERERSTGRG